MTILQKAATLCLIASKLLVALSPQEQAFIERYRVDAHVQAILDAHVQELKEALDDAEYFGEGTHFVWTFRWLPGYFVKANLDRIVGMERMQRCIDQNKLNLITLPDKRIYHIKGRPHSLSSENYLVVVKKVEQGASGPLTLEQVKQLCTLIKKTDYISMTRTNYIQQKQNKLCIIDTESTFDDTLILKGYLRLLMAGHDINKDYTPEALRYILDQIILEKDRPYTSKDGYHWKNIAPFLAKKYKRSSQEWDYHTYFKQQILKKSATNKGLS